MNPPQYPKEVTDVNGLAYTLVRPPEQVSESSSFPAVYRGPDGRDYTPHLEFVEAVRRGVVPSSPVMLSFQ